jgi:ankyrin repeat protein
MSLHEAASLAKVRDLKKLLKDGADPNAKDENDRSPLLLLLQAGFLIADKSKLAACAQLLLAAGADPNVVESQDQHTRGEAALMLAVRDELPELVDALIQAGANVQHRAPNGKTALDLATERGSPLELHQRLLAAGGVRTVRFTLAQAASSGDLARVTELLAQGARVDQRDDQGFTPLEYAAMYGHEAIFDALLATGADPHATNSLGENLLVSAACSDKVSICRKLLDLGLDVNGGDHNFATPLMNAAGQGQLAVARLLLEAGADVTVKKHMGMTALKMARNGPKETRKVMVELLQSSGAALDPAFETVKTIARAAEAPEFQAWAQQLAQTLETVPKPWPKRKGVLQFNVRRLDRLAVAWAAREGIDMTTVQEPAQHLVKHLQDQALAASYQLVHAEAAGDEDRFAKLLLIPIADKFAVLVGNGTNGANYGLDTNEIIRWFCTMDKTNPFIVTGCGHDFVGGRFLGPLQETAELAEQMIRFCPDLVDGEEICSAADVAAGLEAERDFFFWWD